MGTETASVLFTDVVGSTELRERLGQDRADGLRRVHDRIVADAADGYAGRVVKGLGDGSLAVFSSAADAVGAAVATQQQVEVHSRQQPDDAFDLRVGISVGDLLFEDDDCFGTAVIEAARLCDAAQPGQVLVADVVRMLSRGRGGFSFESVGALELKGLADPVAACFVAWEPPEVGVGPVPLAPLLAPALPVDYTGRLGLLADLRKAWQATAGREGSRTVLLVGEPGIGKTRTAGELARDAHDAGAVVLYGRCDEQLGLSYEPFVEALDWQTSHAPGLPLGRFGGDLRRLVPDLDARVAGLPPAIRSDPRTEEHRLLEATASWLTAASKPSGLVLVVDDLHWATLPTLQLLLHVARTAAADPDGRLVVVATYRDTDIDRSHPLFDTIGDLRRLPRVERLPVDPLTEAEVFDLIARAAGHDLDDATRTLARRAHAETEGNPFFVGEVLRHFIETGVVRFEQGRWVVTDPDHIDVPEAVRDVIGRRLNRLSDAANRLLAAAAVIGREFDLDIAAEVAELTLDETLDPLDEALRARLVEEAGPARFRFVHALTREALYGELSATRRRRLHHKVVQAVERHHPSDVTALASHSLAAGPVDGDLTGAIGYTIAAGEQALAARAVADAHRWFTKALELLSDTGQSDPTDLLRARCGLGEAQHDMGDPAHRDTLLAATHDALAAGHLDLAVRATVANSRILPSVVGAVDQDRVAALEAVLDALGDDPRPERAILLATLAAELIPDPPAVDRRLSLGHQAIHIAATSDDAWLRARVAGSAIISLMAPDRVDTLVGHCEQAVADADTSDDPLLQVVARGTLTFLQQMNGDLVDARRIRDQARAIAEDGGSPNVQWTARMISLQHLAWDGDLDGARMENQRCLELGQQAGEPDAAAWWGAVAVGLAMSDGTYGDLADLLGSYADQYPNLVQWRVTQGHALCTAGRTDEATRLVAEHHLDRPENVPLDLFTLATWASQAQIAWHLDHRPLARQLLPVLTRHAHRWHSISTWTYLPLATHLAIAHHTVGDLDAAAVAARDAWSTLSAAGIHCSYPMGAAYLTRVLASRGTPDDVADARRIAERGLAEAQAMGMERRVEELTTILADLATDGA